MSSSHHDLAIQILVAQTLNVSHKMEPSTAFARAATLVIRTLLAGLSVYWTRIAHVIKAAHGTSVLILVPELVASTQNAALRIT